MIENRRNNGMSSDSEIRTCLVCGVHVFATFSGIYRPTSHFERFDKKTVLNTMFRPED